MQNLSQQTLSLAIQKTLAILNPPSDQSIADWCDENRVLTAPPANAPGQWQTSRMPHLRGVMNAFQENGVTEIVMMAAARGGKTSVMENVLAYAAANDPGLLLVVMPTIGKAEEFARDHIDPMFDGSPSLKGIILKANGNQSGSQVRSKIFPGGRLTIVSTESDSELRGITARWVLMDEVSAYGQELKGRGDVVKLAKERARSATYNKKIGLFSTPGEKGKCRIEKEYNLSGKRQYLAKCPSCGHEHELSFWNVQWYSEKDEETKQSIHYPETAKYICPGCAAEWSDADKARAIDAGRWTDTAPINGRIGYNFSTLINKAIPMQALAAEYLEAKGDRESYKQFVTEVLGQTWEDRQGAELDLNVLQRRQQEDLDNFDAEIPTGAAILTMSVDTQGDQESDAGYLQYSIVGYGRSDEAWVLENGVIHKDPKSSECWTELQNIYLRPRKRADGSTSRPRVLIIDAGGAHTQRVIDECVKREGMGWFACRGMNDSPGKRAPIWSSVKIANGQNAGKWRNIGSQAAKDVILGNIAKVEKPGPGYVHFSPFCDPDWFEQVLNEKRRYVRSSGGAGWKWEPSSSRKRTEAADTLAYSYVGAVALRVMFRDAYEQALKEEDIRIRRKESGHFNSSTDNDSQSQQTTQNSQQQNSQTVRQNTNQQRPGNQIAVRKMNTASRPGIVRRPTYLG